jgi:hypothetical protein
MRRTAAIDLVLARAALAGGAASLGAPAEAATVGVGVGGPAPKGPGG